MHLCHYTVVCVWANTTTTGKASIKRAIQLERCNRGPRLLLVKLRTLARCIAYVDFVRPGPRLCVRTALPALQRVTGDHSQIVVYCHPLESIDHTW